MNDLFKKIASVFFLWTISSPATPLNGKISDEITRKPIADAQITWISANARKSAVSDIQGLFSFEVPAEQGLLTVDALGYERVEITLNPSSSGISGLTVSLKSSLQDLGSTRVNTQLAGQAKALNNQRTADNFRHVISTDQIARFPDQNAAEALSRVPERTLSGIREKGVMS